MATYTQNIINYSEGNLTEEEKLLFEQELMTNKELQQEFNLITQVDSYMKTKFEVEQIESELKEEELTDKLELDFSDFELDSPEAENIREFVSRGIMSSHRKIAQEIEAIEDEMHTNDIDELAAEWVEEWDNTPQDDQLVTGIRNYVDTALQEMRESREPEQLAEVKTLPVLRLIKNNKRTLAMAASIVLLIGLSFILLFNKSQSIDDIYADNYSQFESFTEQYRSSDAENTSVLNQGKLLYNQGEIAEASEVFDGLIQSNALKHMNEVYFYAGLVELEQNKYKESIEYFQEVVAIKREFEIEAMWYLGLCYIKTNKIGEARAVFSELSEIEGIYKKKSRDILKQLD